MSGSFRRLLSILFVAPVIVAPAAARAQAVVANPTTVEFSPSADHDNLLDDGRPVVDHYNLDVYVVGAAQPFQSSNLGKPAPGTDGLIRYNFSASVPAWPLPGGTYLARVAAIGPTGAAASDPSNEFVFASCAYALSGSSASLPASGGGTQVGVTTDAACSWTATSAASWITLSPSAGTGSGAVIATVAANTSTTARVASITVAGQPFTISEQAGASSPPPPPPPTGPGVPSNPTPASGSGGLSTTPTLTWTSTGATSYTIRFGTVNPPPDAAAVATSRYTPGTLGPATTYYWQVIALNSVGATAGPVWQFKTSGRGKKK